MIQPNEDLFSYIARVQLLAIQAATISEGNHTSASKRLGYRRPSLVALKQKLRTGNYRGSKQENPALHFMHLQKVLAREALS